MTITQEDPLQPASGIGNVGSREPGLFVLAAEIAGHASLAMEAAGASIAIGHEGAALLAERLEREPSLIGQVVYCSPATAIGFAFDRNADLGSAEADWTRFAQSAIAVYRAHRGRVSLVEAGPGAGSIASGVLPATLLDAVEDWPKLSPIARLVGHISREGNPDLDDLDAELEACSVAIAGAEPLPELLDRTLVSDLVNLRRSVGNSMLVQGTLVQQLESLEARLADAALEKAKEAATAPPGSTVDDEQADEAPGKLATYADLLKTQLVLGEETIETTLAAMERSQQFSAQVMALQHDNAEMADALKATKAELDRALEDSAHLQAELTSLRAFDELLKTQLALEQETIEATLVALERSRQPNDDDPGKVRMLQAQIEEKNSALVSLRAEAAEAAEFRAALEAHFRNINFGRTRPLPPLGQDPAAILQSLARSFPDMGAISREPVLKTGLSQAVDLSEWDDVERTG